MNGITELVNSEVPAFFTGGNSIFEIAIWMIGGIFALFAGLNFKKIFAKSNFDVLLFVFLLPVAIFLFNFEKSIIIVGVYFIGRLLFRFSDKEEFSGSQLPHWLLIIIMIIGVGYTGYRVYTNEVTENAFEYAVTAQDTFFTGEMPYSTKTTEALMPGPFAYTLTYVPLSLSPMSAKVGDQCYYLTDLDNPQDLKAANKIQFLKINEITPELKNISINTQGLKIFQLFALLVFIAGLFAIGLKFGSPKTAMFMLILFLFLPWQSILFGAMWKILAIGFFLWAIFFIRKSWIAGIFLAASVAVFPLLILTLPLFIGYYMPNIGRKGLWMITLGILVTGFVFLLFAPQFNPELFGFLPTKIFGFILLFVGLLSSLLLSIVGEKEEKAPGGFMFSFLTLIVLAVIAVVLMTSAGNYSQGFADFGNNVLGKMFASDTSGLNNLAIPVFMLLAMIAFVPRSISEGGLIVLASSLILFVTFAFGIQTSGTELILLIPALFVSHKKGTMPAEDKAAAILIRKSIKDKITEENSNSDQSDNQTDGNIEGAFASFFPNAPQDEALDISAFQDDSFDSSDPNAEIPVKLDDEAANLEKLLGNIQNELPINGEDSEFGNILKDGDQTENTNDEENT